MEDAIRIDTPAAFGPRLVAWMADGAILWAGDTVLSRVITAAAGSLWTSIASILLNLAYFWILTGAFGRTPGKIAQGIELRHPSGRIGFGTAFLREVLGKMVAYGALGIGVLWIAFDRDKRGWHDMIAGTRAVRVERIVWRPRWDDRIKTLLAGGTTVTASMLEGVPERWRAAIMQEFARRHPEVARVDHLVAGLIGAESRCVLRPVSTIEEF